MTPDRPRVLIIEKSPEVGLLEAAVVKRAGCMGEIAGEGAEALTRLERDPPDVLILGSPVELEHGVIVLDLLAGRLHPLARRTILLTAYVDSPTLLIRAAKARVFAVVAKPFDVETVCDLIARCAENAGREGDVAWVGVKPSVVAKLTTGVGA